MLPLAQRLNLQPADVLIAPKSAFNFVKHMIVYWGRDTTGQDFYLENNPKTGVRWLTAEQLEMQYQIIAIKKFTGTQMERALAIQRGISQLGAQYNLTSCNCEHYANYVQTGSSFSKQSSNGVKLGLLALGITVLISASKG